MKRLYLTGAALAVALASPALAQGQPQPPGGRSSQPQSFEQAMAQQQQQAAQREAQSRAQAERDLARMTPEARDQMIDYARNRLNQVAQTPGMQSAARDLRRDIERADQNIGFAIGGNDVFNPDPGQIISNQQFGQEAAHGGVQAINGMTQLQRDSLQSMRPLAREVMQATADIYRERERLILQSNPNMSDADRARLAYETRQATNAAATIDRRLDEADYRIRDQQQRLRESEDRIAAEMERMANQQGQDVTQWQMPTGRVQGTRLPVRPRPQPVPQPASAPPPSAEPPPPAPTQTASSGGARGPVRRGTIPPADPYEGLRVPQSQGGTGANPPPQGQNNQNQAAADRARQQQDQANAERTERNRQAAQARADADNAEADSIFGAAERERQRRAARERADMEQELRDYSRPGNAGGGGAGGGSGSVASSAGAAGDAGQGSDGQYSPTEAFVFDDGGSYEEPEPDPWQSFELGGIITVAELVPIYDGYDWSNAPVGSSGRSLSSAGNSLSSAGNSLSSAGTSLSSMGSITPSSAPTGMRVDWGGLDLASDPVRWSNGGRPAPGSYAEMLAQLNGQRPSLLPTDPWEDVPWATSNADLARALYGPLWSDRPYQIQADPYGRRGRGLGGPEMANLFDTDLDVFLRLLGSDFDYLRLLLASDRGGLDRILAQPFNVVLTWGANAYDLDLHMTGPLTATTDRFHIYYAATGRLDAAPFAQLVKDCICSSGSEVILTSALTRDGGVYRVSVFNFGDQSASSTNLANQSQATLQIVRGGVAVSVGSGTTIEGGTTLLATVIPPGQAGNTWIAAEIDPRNGTITAPGVVTNSQGSGNVD